MRRRKVRLLLNLSWGVSSPLFFFFFFYTKRLLRAQLNGKNRSIILKKESNFLISARMMPTCLTLNSPQTSWVLFVIMPLLTIYNYWVLPLQPESSHTQLFNHPSVLEERKVWQIPWQKTEFQTNFPISPHSQKPKSQILGAFFRPQFVDIRF